LVTFPLFELNTAFHPHPFRRESPLPFKMQKCHIGKLSCMP
jgi:hypothetical protein